MLSLEGSIDCVTDSTSIQNTTPLLAEITAIGRATDLVKREGLGSEVGFHVDCEGALRALANPITNSRTVQACKASLQELQETGVQPVFVLLYCIY